MKKLMTLALMVFFGHTLVFGQLSLRPQAGVNFASFADDLFDTEWKSNVGFQFGVDLQIGNTFYVQPGINYQETKLKSKGLESTEFTTTRLNIPLVFGFRMFEQESSTFGARIFAGPNFAIHLDEDFGDAITGLSSDDFKTAYVGVLAGVGLDISIIFVDVAYMFGVTDFIEVEALNEGTNTNIFLINAGVRIGF